MGWAEEEDPVVRETGDLGGNPVLPKSSLLLGEEVHACNSSTQEAEVGRLCV